MKRLKLFESYTSDYEMELVDHLYEKLERTRSLYEAEYRFEEEEPEMSAGEKRAFDRDLQVISRPQLAAIYLKALGRSEGEEGAYLVMIDGIKDFGEFDPNTRAFTITNPAFADAIGLKSVSTITRTVNKFVNLIDGVGETQQEVIYPKVISAYDYFSTKTPVQISTMAAEAIQDANEYTLNRDKAEVSKEKSSVIRAEKQKEEDLIGGKIFSLINALKSSSDVFKEPGRAQKLAIRKISTETEKPEDKIKEYYRKYLISRGLMSSINFDPK